MNELTSSLVARARKGEGPFFMELMTYRYHGHHSGRHQPRILSVQGRARKDWKENLRPLSSASAASSSKQGIATERRDRGR